MIEQNFGSESTNPRDKRAFAHTAIKKFKDDGITYNEAFDAAHATSNTSKGKRSGFGTALGNIKVDGYSQDGLIQNPGCPPPIHFASALSLPW